MYQRIRTSLRWRLLSPFIPQIESTEFELITLGSKYGRKTFAKELISSLNPVLISAGVGEDVSFDLEFQVLYDAQVILVDPTPSAILHFQAIQGRSGRLRETPYSETNVQKPESYSLEKVDFDKISYVAKAVWSEETMVSFFQPTDLSRDGSFSIDSIDTFYEKSTSSIKVYTTTISNLVRKHAISFVDIIKLDVEGAALDTLVACFQSKIFPNQLLVEVDELHFPCLKSKLRAEQLFRLIRRAGYEPIHRDNCDFLFVRSTDHD